MYTSKGMPVTGKQEYGKMGMQCATGVAGNVNGMPKGKYKGFPTTAGMPLSSC